MSGEADEHRCEEPGCTAVATKHLHYMPAAEVMEQTSDHAALSTRDHHLDYCDDHVATAHSQHGGQVREINEQCSPACPKHPDTGRN